MIGVCVYVCVILLGEVTVNNPILELPYFFILMPVFQNCGHLLSRI